MEKDLQPLLTLKWNIVMKIPKDPNNITENII